MKQQKEQEEAAAKDDKAFEQASSLDSRIAYGNYLMTYPDGRHVEDAKTKIAAIVQAESAQESAESARRVEETEAERQKRLEAAAAARKKAEEEERVRLDDGAYQQSVIVNTPQAYSTYLNLYPQGRHVGEARGKLTELDAVLAAKQKSESEETARKDDQAFALAARDNSKQSYSTYLISFPNGRHSEEARDKIAALERREAEAEKVRSALNVLNLRMVRIPGGSFLLGSEKGYDDEKPVNTVTVSAFEMSAMEITQGQYRGVTDTNPSYFKLDDNSPVERVNWKDAVTFCNRLSERVGLEPCYNLATGACDFSKSGFRLPTEAEWEYACRAESGLDYNLGDGESALDRAGWYQRNSQEKTHPAGQKTANTWGLYDMHGNVWEWCNDWYDKGAYQANPGKDPAGPHAGKEKILRGGGWLDTPKDSRSAKRRSYDPEKNYSDIGFRIVRR